MNPICFPSGDRQRRELADRGAGRHAEPAEAGDVKQAAQRRIRADDRPTIGRERPQTGPRAPERETREVGRVTSELDGEQLGRGRVV
jgi:hypothetical protein